MAQQQHQMQQQHQKFLGLFWENYETLPTNDQQQHDLSHFMNILMRFTKLFQFSNLDIVDICSPSNNPQVDENFLERIQYYGFNHHFMQNNSTENILTQILFWLWDSVRSEKFGISPPTIIIVTNSPTTISLMKKFKSRGIYVIIISNLSTSEIKDEAFLSSNAIVDINELIEHGTNLGNDQNSSTLREIVMFSSIDDEMSFPSDAVRVASTIPPQPKISPTAANIATSNAAVNAIMNSSSIDSEKSQFQYPQSPSSLQNQTLTQSSTQIQPPPQLQNPPVIIPSGIPATWSEHLQQQKQQGAKPPSLPSLVTKHENPSHNVFYDPHSGKPVYSTNRPSPTGPYTPTYGQQLVPHEIPSPSTIDIAASGGFWSTLQKQPMQRWDDPNAGNPVVTETLTKEQRVLHDDLVTAIYAYNVNAAVSTLRKMYTKQTRTFRIPTVLGILLPDTAAMIVDGRTDLLNVAVCFALDSIQWCFGVQKGENIESFKYKMNANIARWILHETVKKGIPSTPTPVIQEATISVVNHILENVVELEFAWEMLTTLNISHPVQRIVPHVLAWRGYPNPSIEARVNDFLYDHPEIGTIIPPSNPNPNMHMAQQQLQQSAMQFRTGGPVSPTSTSTSLPPSGNDRTSHMVQAFLRDQQRHHQGMDYPMNNPHIPNQSPNQMPPEGLEDPMMDRNMMKLMGRTGSGDMAPRMSPLYRDEFADPMRLRGMEGGGGVPGQGNDKLYRMKGNNPSPNSQSSMRPGGRFPGDNNPGPQPTSHMDYPITDDYSMHHHAFSNPPRDEVYARSQGGGPPQSSNNASRDFPGRGGSGAFPSGKDLHHFDQEYSNSMPLEGDDYLGSLSRAPTEEGSYMFGQQNFDFTLTKES